MGIVTDYLVKLKARLSIFVNLGHGVLNTSKVETAVYNLEAKQ
jgi:hypothetical protein